MDKPFFIMIYGQRGGAFPIIEADESIAFFETEEEARELAENHSACQVLGYEIFEMGIGN